MSLLAQKVIVGYHCTEQTPIVNGILDDPCWQSARPIGEFVQNEPNEGQPSSERTEVRVVFSQHDIYVGITAFDSSPKGPVRLLARRDSVLPCDWVTVWIDSLGDKRTAFQFSVNPSGVKRDVYWYDEARTDSNWDPVWDVAVGVSPGVWTAEFKIPLSQLRFPKKENQGWGFQVERFISRIQERSYWAPVPRGSPRFVSLFGLLVLEHSLQAPRHLQLIPFGMGKVTLSPAESDDPFTRPFAPGGSAGLDAKYGLSSNFTLDVSVNPDFGQVESDPSYMNLSAYEVYLPEKRPFFIEGGNIYSFSLALGNGGDGFGGDTLFYSRRIGRSPQVVPDEALYYDLPFSTPIIAAFKLTGKTENGWSLGILEALTSKVAGEFALADESRITAPAEPLTNYTVGRVQKDFRQGRSALGAIFTLVKRDIQDAALDVLATSAVTGGFDFRHRWQNDRYEVSGALVGSQVAGSSEAIRRVQESSARYFQRPDNDYAHYDPSRTSLSGYAFRLSLGKIDGSHWLWSLGASGLSPGFETNDLGYLREADTINVGAAITYRDLKPNRFYRSLEIGSRLYRLYTFAPEPVCWGGNVDAFLLLANYWDLSVQARRMDTLHSWATLRGGPIVIMPGNWHLSSGLGTDSRRPISMYLGGGLELGDEGMRQLNLSLNLTARIRENLSLELSPSFSSGRNPLQYVGTPLAGSRHYIFAHIDQKTASLTLRLNYAISSVLTLQLYVQPFISSGLFSRFKEVSEPLASRYADRWHEYSSEEISASPAGYDVSLGSDSFHIANPDFNFQEFRLNAVLRWEYRPGSAVYVVWTRGCDNTVSSGDFDLGRDVRSLSGTPSTNIFLVKFTYWFNI